MASVAPRLLYPVQGQEETGDQLGHHTDRRIQKLKIKQETEKPPPKTKGKYGTRPVLPTHDDLLSECGFFNEEFEKPEARKRSVSSTS